MSGPEVHLAGGRVAYVHRVGFRGELLDVLVEQRLVDDVAADRHADLALVQERAPGREIDRLVDVGVGSDDVRRVASELQVGSGQMPAGEFADHPSRTRRAGEGDDVDMRVGDHRLADLRASRDELQESRGQAGLLEDAHHRHPAGDHRAGVGLEEHGVAEGESGGDGTDAEDQRNVEGRDDADDADRDLLRQREPRLFAGEDRSERRGRQSGSLVALGGGDVQGEPGQWRDRAHLADVPAADLVGVLLPELTGLAQHGGPGGMRQGGPLLLRAGCALRGASDIGGIGDADHRQGLTGGRLDGWDLATASGDPLAVDEDPAREDGCVQQAVRRRRGWCS